MARISTLARFEVSGELLNEDVLALLALTDSGVPGAEMDRAEEGDLSAAWELLRDQWQAIRSEVADFDTERLRRRWIVPLLEMLGHEPQFLKSHPTLPDGRTFPITHRTETIPLWLADYDHDPDQRPDAGKRRRSSHELFQEYIDAAEDDWGILCTGRTIRLLCDYHKTLTRNFVEADLESIFDELDFDAFRIVWRLFRASAFVPKAKGVLDIERIRDHARLQGTEIGKELRKQVVEALVTLGNGFLDADDAGELRQRIENHPEGPMVFYQALLRIVYRLLFLLYVENKPGWTPAQDPRWASAYSISRLRALAEDHGSYRAEGKDLWEGLKVTFRVIREGCTLFNEPIYPYGGELFDDSRLWLLQDAPLENAPLLRALYLLTVFQRRQGRETTVHRVNFRSLRIDALGSVYESLLEERPLMTPEGRFDFYVDEGRGNQRKATGSYYTPPELVAELIKTALLPVIDDRLKEACRSLGLEVGKSKNWLQEVINDAATGKQRIEPAGDEVPSESGHEDAVKTLQARLRRAVLGINVVDPACGSGAFLIQALDALAEALLKIQLGDERPSELQLREARRDAAVNCIHGVDLNPMAVELCKFTVWLHVAHPRFPLSYLEPKIRCGNSLVGVPTKAQIEETKRLLAEQKAEYERLGKRSEAKNCVYIGWEGFDLEESKRTKLPDEAFANVGDDDKDYAKSLQKRNADERKGQLRLTDAQKDDYTKGRLDVYRQMMEVVEDAPEAVKEKAERYGRYLQSGVYQLPKLHADAWCAAFFWRLKEDGPEPPTQRAFESLHPARLRADGSSPADPALVREVQRLAEELCFFHWELEFPHVFERGGFDVVLGNPPWNKLKLVEQRWFAGRNNEIAGARNKAARERLIEELRNRDPQLYAAYNCAKHTASAISKFTRGSLRFPLSAKGDANLYALFAETDRSLALPGGRAGFICPTGIATDDTTKDLFGAVAGGGELTVFYDFENKEQLFDIHRSFKFALIGLARGGAEGAEMRFFLTHPDQIADPERAVRLTAADFRLMNPNTRTAPVPRTRQDAELLRFLYERVPVLVNERTGENPWGIRYSTMFHMSNDSNLFKTRDQLEAMGARFEDGVWIVGGEE